MSESATRRLTAESAKSVVGHFADYLNGKSAVIQIQENKQPEAGLPVHLDGEAFIAGFVEYLKSTQLDPALALETFADILEISSYVRAGGAKSCLYRLETGCSISPTDFYDSLSEQLRFSYQNGKLVSVSNGGAATSPPGSSSASAVSMLQKLRSVSEADEEIVQQLQSKIDANLLLLAQKLEALTQDPFL